MNRVFRNTLDGWIKIVNMGVFAFDAAPLHVV
jgi:hypothetical protein